MSRGIQDLAEVLRRARLHEDGKWLLLHDMVHKPADRTPTDCASRERMR